MSFVYFGTGSVVLLGELPFRTEDGIEAPPIRSFLDELEGKTL